VELLRTLSVEIGVRRCGTPEAERAAHAVADAFAALGLEPRFQEFPLLGYEAEEPLLEVDGERWEAGPCMYAHPGEIEGEVRRLSEGIFAVGDEGRLRRSPFGVSAIPFMGAGGHATTPPTAFISPADAARLRDGMRARLVVRGRFVPGLRDRNVVAELPGASEETVVVGAHYDSVWRGPGAIDNATGVEGLLCVAERLVGREHPRSLAFVAFGAEEIGLLGSKHYVSEAKSRDEVRRIVGMVNLDCIGHGESLELLCTPAALLERAEATTRRLGLYDRYGVVTELGQDAGTDHLPFALVGIPAMSVLHFPYDEYHSPEDSPDLVDERLMADAVDLAVAMVESQLAEPVERAQ
jgi:Iap family predicted aminopeptidase